MSFWPVDITADDAISPREIMERAGDELSRRTKVLTASIQENRLPDRIVLTFTVRNQDYLIEFNLFEAIHRLDQTYPVVIDPPSSDIPEFLRRKRYLPGQPGISSMLMRAYTFESITGLPSTFVENEWVCATPTEFTEKLRKLFALDHVKSRIISLQAPTTIQRSPESATKSTGEPLEKEDEVESEDEPEPPGEFSGPD